MKRTKKSVTKAALAGLLLTMPMSAYASVGEDVLPPAPVEVITSPNNYDTIDVILDTPDLVNEVEVSNAKAETRARHMTISWNASGLQDVGYVKIYKNGDSYLTVNANAGIDSIYDYEAVIGESNTYRIVTIDKNNIESAGVTVTAKHEIFIPEEIKDVEITKEGTAYRITWKNPIDNFEEVNIFNADGLSIETTDGTDVIMPFPDKTTTYKFVAISPSGGLSEGVPVTLQYVPPAEDGFLPTDHIRWVDVVNNEETSEFTWNEGTYSSVNIYKTTPGGKVLVGTSDTNKFTLNTTDIGQGNFSYYSIIPVSAEGRDAYGVEQGIIGGDRTPPASVTSVTYEPEAGKPSVIIRHNFMEEMPSDMAGYYIYKDGVRVDARRLSLMEPVHAYSVDVDYGVEHEISVVSVDMGGNRSKPATIKVRHTWSTGGGSSSGSGGFSGEGNSPGGGSPSGGGGGGGGSSTTPGVTVPVVIGGKADIALKDISTAVEKKNSDGTVTNLITLKINAIEEYTKSLTDLKKISLKLDEDAKAASQLDFSKDVLNSLRENSINIAVESDISTLDLNFDHFNNINSDLELGKIEVVMDTNSIDYPAGLKSIVPLSPITDLKINFFDTKGLPIEDSLTSAAKIANLSLKMPDLGKLDPLRANTYKVNEKTGEFDLVRSVTRDGVKLITPDTSGKYVVMYNDKKFDDLSNHWARNEVEFLASKEIINGVTEENFDPNKTVTRAEFTSMITRAVAEKKNEVTNISDKFGDVSEDSWYASDVAGAIDSGIVQGLPDGSFNPNAEITREQMAVVIIRMVEKLDPTNPALKLTSTMTFSDSDAISDWALTSVETAQNLGLMLGDGLGSFNAVDSGTRAEAATVLDRALRTLKLY